MKRLYSEKAFEILRVLTSMLIALGLAVVMITFVSVQPLAALGYFLVGPLDSPAHIGNVVEMAIPLAFTGLYFTVSFKANMFNLGAEGVFFSTALFSAVMAVNTSLPPVVHPIIILIGAALLGALLGMIPGFLQVKWGANTLVISLMMNYILYGICMYLLNNKFRDITAYAIATPKFEASAKLMRIIPGTRIHAGLILLILVCAGLYFFLMKTKWGYELRMMGINQRFAAYVGMKPAAVILMAHALSGLFAGLGGSVEILGMYNKFQWTALPGYGLDGALVALLAKSDPALVPLAALFLAYIRIGPDMMSRMTDVPAEMVAAVQAIIILLISSQMLFHRLREKMLLKEVKGNE